MRINLQMIVLICIAVITNVLGISIFRGMIKSPEAPICAAIMIAGCLCMFIFTFKVGSSSSGGKHIIEICFPMAYLFLPISRSIPTLLFSDQQMHDVIRMPIRQIVNEFHGQRRILCIKSTAKQQYVGSIGVESTSGNGSNFHVSLHRKEFY